MGSWSHSSQRAVWSSGIVIGVGWQAATCLPNASQAFSIGFMYGDLAGQSMLWISSNSSTRMVRCAHVLSAMKIKSGPTVPLKSCTCCWSTSFLYLYCVIVPLAKTCSSIRLLNMMTAHTSVPPPSDWSLYMMFLRLNDVPGSIRMNVWQESFCKLNLNWVWICEEHVSVIEISCPESQVNILLRNSNSWGCCKFWGQLL